MRARSLIAFPLLLAFAAAPPPALPVARPAAPPAAGASAPTSRRAIQSAYNAMNAALAKKNLNGVWAHRTKDYVQITATGKKILAPQLRPQEQAIVTAAQSITAQTAIRSFAQKGDTATVSVSERGTLVMNNTPARRKPKVIVTQTSRDEWVRQNGRWRIKHSTILTHRATVDGKVVPGL